MMLSLEKIFYGGIISPETLTSYKALPNCLLLVNASGIIEWIEEDVAAHELQGVLAAKGFIDVDIITTRPGEFLLPGFVDTHTHAPQFPNLGCGQEFELLDWLNNVTFPMEAKFSDVKFARRCYETVVRRIIDYGTTTCCYYGTLHLEATKILADIVHANGQRAIIGKCNMDRNSPEYYRECSVMDSIRDTQDLISHIRVLSGLPNAHHKSDASSLILPGLTPRFAVSCTPKLLSALQELASSDQTLRIQTHISENKSEIALVKKLFPTAPHYAGVYDSYGLLRCNTILAHAVWLEDGEVELIAERKAGISHCPTSNFNLFSGVAPIGRYLDKGIKVGLGTDVSGGFSPSILNCIQNASIAAKVIALREGTHASNLTQFANRQLSVATLLYLATMGGAEVCNIDKVIGSFAPGKSFDALLINTRADAGNPGLWLPEEDPVTTNKQALESQLQRFLFDGDDRNISRVYVQGRFIGGKAFQL